MRDTNSTGFAVWMAFVLNIKHDALYCLLVLEYLYGSKQSRAASQHHTRRYEYSKTFGEAEDTKTGTESILSSFC